MNKFALLLPCAVMSSACHDATYFEYSGTQLGSTPVLVTSASVRLVTDRINPTGDLLAGQPRHVICTEPSPDVAKAFDSAVSIAASVAGKGEGSFSEKSAEQLAQLTARLPSIQALRDAVYRACEAYANGVLGANAYAMMVSRYGELLVTLMLGENAAGNFGKDLVTLQGLDLSIPAKPASQSPSGAPATPKPSPGAQTSQLSGSAGAAPVEFAGLPRGAGIADPNKPDRGYYLMAVTQDAGAAGPAAAAPPAAGAAVNPAPAQPGHPVAAGGHPAKPAAGGGKAKTPSPSGTAETKPKPASGNPPVATAADDLEKMQENYLKLLTYVGPMMVTCVNMLDDSRPLPNHNQFWEGFCQNLLQKLEDLDIDRLRRLYGVEAAATSGSRRARK